MNLPYAAGGAATIMLFAGCTTVFYKNQADKHVYEILQKVEEDIFGKSTDFSIDTPYSGKKPEEITDQNILSDRSPTAEKIVLPIDEAVDYAIAHSREYQSERESLYLAALNLTGERHDFFPQFFAGTRATGTRLEDGERRGTVNSNIGVTQALLTGADIGISIANDLLRYYTGDPRKSAASAISMNLFQPLLRGAGRKIAGEQLKQAHRNVFYAIRDYSHFQSTFAVDIVIEYYRLLQDKDVIYNQYANYVSRKQDADYLRARSVDRANLEQVASSEQEELRAKNSYINSIANFRDSLNRFKTTLGMPQTVDLRLDDSELTKLRDAGLIPLDLGTAGSFRIALENRLPLLNELDRYEDQKRQVALAADRLKADLNIIGDASLENDEGPTEYEKFDFNNVRASVGVQLNLPLDRLRERNQYRATLINFESAIRRLGLTFDQLRNQIDQDLRELRRLRLSYEITKSAVAIAENRVVGNRLRFQAGTLRLNELTDSQDDLIEEQNQVTAELVSYLAARLRFLAYLGILASDKEVFWLEEDAITIDLPERRPEPNEIVTENFEATDDLPTPEEIFAD